MSKILPPAGLRHSERPARAERSSAPRPKPCKKAAGASLWGRRGGRAGLRFCVKLPLVARLLLVAGLAGMAAAQAPYDSGVATWTPDDPAAPAIPRAIVVVGGGELAFVARSGGGARFELAGLAASGAQAPLAVHPLPGTSNSLAVAAGDGLDELYGLSQLQIGGPVLRRSEVRCFDALAWSAGGQAVRWQHDLPVVGNGPARIACGADGARVFAAQWDDQQQQVVLDALRGADGALLWRHMRPAQALAALAVAQDGTRAAYLDGASVVVLGADGALLASEPLVQSSIALALDGDGDRVAHGDGALVKVLQQTGAGWSLAKSIAGLPGEVAVRVQLSRDGATLAVAWWTATTTGGVRMEVWDLVAQQRLFQLQQSPLPGGLQNYPEALCLSADGRLAAWGLWGDGSSRAEVVAWDRQTNLTVAALDLGASAMALALSADGRRLVVGRKQAHASQIAPGGELRTVELAPRDLVVRAQARSGAPLLFGARRAGALGAILLDGQAAPAPVFLGGLSGPLFVLRQGARIVRTPCDASGEALGQLPLPAAIAQPGTRRHLQAVFRTPAGHVAGATLAEPLVLP